jgi:hypothetical protein
MDKMLKKNFSTAKKLTEGDNAFQEYAMENKDRVGSSTPPIDIQEPPVSKISKADISTMAPKENIGENGIDNEIEYDNPVDKIKKDYPKVPGVFSTQHQIPGEMSNQISAPEKVDAVVETRKRNNVAENREPYFDKMDEEELFKAIDDLIFEEEMVDLYKSITAEQSSPVDAKSLAAQLERNICVSLRAAVNSWFEKLDDKTEIDDALVALKKSLICWVKNNDIRYDFNNLINLGAKAGTRKTKAPISKDFYNSIISSLDKRGFSPSLQGIAEEVFSILSKDTKKYGIGSYKHKKAIDTEMKVICSMVKTMIKNKIASSADAGANAALEGEANFK